MTTGRTGRSTAPHGWKRWSIVVVMVIAELMDMLDSTIVNVAGPSLEKSLGTSSTALQWIIGGYALSLGAGLVLGGRLGDRFGRRRIFLLGLAGFTLTSWLCALAPNSELLIAFRLAQGITGALLLPQGLGLLRENFSGKELAAVFGVFGPVLGIGGVLGPVLGGALVQADIGGIGWRSVFLVNVPVGVVTLAVAWVVLPRRGGDRAIRVDITGAGLVAAAAALLVLPLNDGQSQGWPLWTWVSLATSLALFVAFALQQRTRTQRGKVALVTPTLFAKSAYTAGLVGIALFFSGLIGSQLLLTLFLQTGQGYSAGDAGLGNLPLALGTTVGGALSGAVLAAKLGRSVLQIGSLIQIGGTIALWFELGRTGAFSIWHIVPGLAIAGVGAGMVIAALFSVVLAAVDDDEIGSASGVLSAVQSIAGSAGIAAFGSVFFSTLTSGSAADGFRNALFIQGGLLVAFLGLTFVFPKTARPDEFSDASDESSDLTSA